MKSYYKFRSKEDNSVTVEEYVGMIVWYFELVDRWSIEFQISNPVKSFSLYMIEILA